MERVKQNNEEKWNQKFEKYIKEGLTRVNARIKTKEKMHTKDIKHFLNNYGTLIQYILQLKHGSIHASVMGDKNHFLSEGYDEERSIRMALNKNRRLYLLEEMWDTGDETDSDNSSEEDETEDEYDSEESMEENVL